jgi:hypothetical protein
VIEWVKVVLDEFLNVNVVSVEQLRFLVEQRILMQDMMSANKPNNERTSRNDY